MTIDFPMLLFAMVSGILIGTFFIFTILIWIYYKEKKKLK